MMVAAVVFGRFIRKLSKQTQDEVAASNIVVQDVLTAIVSVKSYANEWLERRKYGTHAAEIKRLAMRGALWRGTFASFIILFIFGAITLVIFKGADLMQQGELASEHFFTFLLMTGLVAGSIGGMAAQFSALQRGLGAIESVMDIVDQDREVEDLNASTPELSLRQTVTLTDVHFNYPQRPDVQVLKGLNLRIDAGDQVALVGTSGAGKSTVASLLLRFHEPDTGVLQVGDVPADGSISGYRQRVAFVPQEEFCLGATCAATSLRTSRRHRRRNHRCGQRIRLEFHPDFEGSDTLVGERVQPADSASVPPLPGPSSKIPTCSSWTKLPAP